MDLTNLDGGQTVLALIVVCLAVVAIVNAVAGIFTRGHVDGDELADRIEAAIKDAAGDLLDALERAENEAERAADMLDSMEKRHADQMHPVRISKD